MDRYQFDDQIVQAAVLLPQRGDEPSMLILAYRTRLQRARKCGTRGPCQRENRFVAIRQGYRSLVREI
jgi:hypothetical protein